MSSLGLPETYRFAILNVTGITISNSPTGLPRVSGRRVRYNTTGALSYEAAEFTFFSFAATTVATNTYVAGSTLSNALSLWTGGEFLFSSFASGGASGTLNLYLEISPDGGTTWPHAASANNPGGGILVAMMQFANVVGLSTASTVQRVVFEL